MRTLLLEVRDRATFVPVLCVEMTPDRTLVDGRPGPWSEEQTYLLRRCGYRFDLPAVMMTRLGAGYPAHIDPYAWRDRTLSVAHDYICQHWPHLRSGDVVDVRFVLGEAEEPAESERVTAPL